MKKYFPLLFVIVVLIHSCKDDDKSASPGINYSYFPVNVGHEAIYDAVLITKDEFSQEEDTAIYQVREVIESIFYDNQGRLTQRIERYHRDNPGEPWVIHDVWTSNLSSTRAEKNEDNIPYVKLVFPMSTGVSWNGNVLNTTGEREYEYLSLNEPEVIGGIPFDSVVTVLQLDEDTFIGKEYHIEKYAPGVGLVYRQNDSIIKNYTNPNDPGVKGQRLYKETLVSWSN